MLKKAVQQGRSERRATLLQYVEGLSDARTPHGKRCVSARRGWAGEISDFFSILLENEQAVRHWADGLPDSRDYGPA
jgi:hypothetical protein